MSYEKILREVIKGSSDYADIDICASKAIELYCEDNGLSQEIAEAANYLFEKEEALNAGIPLSVIEGKTKLTDHFSQEYIDFQCGKSK